MTEDEQKMLRQIHAALFEIQPGEKEPLIDRMAGMSRDWRRMTWAARGVLFILLTLGSAIAAWDKIMAWAKGGV